jgi:hypothetical protein
VARLGGTLPAVSVPAKVLSLKPANLSFEEAVAVPMAGVTALQQSAGGDSAKYWFLASFALHRWLDSPLHSQVRRLQAEVARPSALLRLRIS